MWVFTRRWDWGCSGELGNLPVLGVALLIWTCWLGYLWPLAVRRSALGNGEVGREVLPLSMGALKPLLKLERSTCREYLLFEDGVGIALLLAEVGGRGDPVEGVY